MHVSFIIATRRGTHRNKAAETFMCRTSNALCVQCTMHMAFMRGALTISLSFGGRPIAQSQKYHSQSKWDGNDIERFSDPRFSALPLFQKCVGMSPPVPAARDAETSVVLVRKQKCLALELVVVPRVHVEITELLRSA